MSFLGNYLKTSKGNRMHLLETKDEEGFDAWYYVYVDKSKVEEFRGIIGTGGSIVLSDYGKVIKSGFGKEVPESIKLQMKEEFNFET